MDGITVCAVTGGSGALSIISTHAKSGSRLPRVHLWPSQRGNSQPKVGRE